MSVNPNESVQDYINDINKEFDRALRDIQRMEEALDKIKDKTADIDRINGESKKQRKKDRGQAEQDQKDIDTLKNEIAGCEADLEKIDPAFKTMDDTINSLLADISNMSSEVSHHDSWWKALTNHHRRNEQIVQDIAEIQSYISQITSAMEDKLEADRCEAIIQKGGDLSDDELLKYASLMAGAETQEQSVLNNLCNQTMTQDQTSYHNKVDHEKEVNSRIHWWNGLTGWSVKKENKAIADEANNMMDLIQNTMSSLSPELASSMPEFVQIQVIFQEVMRKVMKIMKDSSLSPKEKQTELLSLMMFALGFFGLILTRLCCGLTG